MGMGELTIMLAYISAWKLTWNVFCFEITIPLSMKEKIRLGYREHSRDGIAYRIPLIIYPSINKSSRGLRK